MCFNIINQYVFKLDKKDRSKIAVIDDSKQSVHTDTYATLQQSLKIICQSVLSPLFLQKIL